MGWTDAIDTFSAGVDKLSGSVSSLAAARDKLNGLKQGGAQPVPVAVPENSGARNYNVMMLGGAGVLLVALLLMRRRRG